MSVEEDASLCFVSFNGRNWTAASADPDARVVGPLGHTPGWDYYDVLTDPGAENCAQPQILHVRRQTPIRLVRVYSHWPAGEPPLASALRPEGVPVATIPLPAAACLPRLIVAICPPALPVFDSPAQLPLKSRSVERRRRRATEPAGRRSLSSSSEVSRLLEAAAEVFHEGRDEAVGDARTPSAELPIGYRDAGTPTCSLDRRVDESSVPSPIALARSPMTSSANAASEAARVGDRLTDASKSAACPSESSTCCECSQEASELREQLSELKGRLHEERLARCTAEELAAASGSELGSLQQEREDLTRKLRHAERAAMATEMQVRTLQSELENARRKLAAAPAAPCRSLSSMDEVVRALVTLELGKLREASDAEKAAEKRRLLLRWHPDKNSGGGGGGGDLATRVLQEIHSRPEWAAL